MLKSAMLKGYVIRNFEVYYFLKYDQKHTNISKAQLSFPIHNFRRRLSERNVERYVKQPKTNKQTANATTHAFMIISTTNATHTQQVSEPFILRNRKVDRHLCCLFL